MNYTKQLLRIDLLGASVAGLFLGVIWCVTRSSGEVDSAVLLQYLVTVEAAYITPALLFYVTGKSKCLKIPAWVIVPVIGSFLSFIIIVLGDDIWPVWRSGKLHEYFAERLADRLVGLILSTSVDSIIAVAIMACFHYGLPKLTKTLQLKRK